jgi:hypothetical protein
VTSDPLFAKVRFDVLIADDAPLIPAPFLLAAAGLARERILLSADPHQLQGTPRWQIALHQEGSPHLATTR